MPLPALLRSARMADRTEGPATEPAAKPCLPTPTLADVAHLTPESDYTAFTAPGVDAQVRNEALRKLFHSDPHFQRSDGLDVADDEVVQLAQSPLARQRLILLARAMGMLDDELQDQPQPAAEPPAP
jgi:Protein of unknown function (DUF3306)